jgi:hypothetical protein
MPIDRPSPGTRALRDFVETLIFSRIFSVPEVSVAIGSTSLTDAVLASFFLRCIRIFSLLAAILQHATHVETTKAVRYHTMHVPLFPESVLPLCLDLPNTLYCLDRCLHQLAVVAHWDISAFLKLNCRVLFESLKIVIRKNKPYTQLSFPCPPPCGRPWSSALYAGCASSYNMCSERGSLLGLCSGVLEVLVTS